MKETNEVKKKKGKLVLAFFSVFGIIVLLLLAISVGFNHTFSWFAANREVSGNGMQVVVDASKFELAINKNVGDNQTSEFITSGSDGIIQYIYDNFGGESVNPTSNEHKKLICKLVYENMDQNDTGIRPGAYGSLSFYISPKDNEITSFDLNLILSGKPIVSGETLSSQTIDILKGHILFFQNRINVTNGHNYTNKITDSFTYDLTQHESDKTRIDGKDYYLVTIYWIWPSTFAQVVCLSGDGRLLHYIPINGTSSDVTDMISYVAANPGEFFVFGEESYIFTSASMNQHFATFNEAFNNGDQNIGENVDYLFVEIFVDEHFSTE